MRMIIFTLLLSLCFAAGSAQAQVLPLERTGSLIVTDSSDDVVYRLTDMNLDGDFHDQGEVLTYYTGNASGDYLGNPITAKVDPSGTVYVVDSSPDFVLAMRDMNGNGDADDSLEEWIWLDNSNATGIFLSSPQWIAFLDDGTAYLTHSGAGTGHTDDDFVFYCHDDNNDGDVNDVNEIDYYYDPFSVDPGLPVLEVPMGCAIGPDGALYVTDLLQDIIYRMEDVNGDGDVNDDVNGTHETTVYMSVIGCPSIGSIPSLNFTKGGEAIMPDGSGDTLWIGFDANGDGTLEDAGEVTEYLTLNGTWPYSSWGVEMSGSNDLYWDVYCADNGKSTVVGDCVLGMRDLNGDGDVNETDEMKDIYNQDISYHFITRTRGVGFMKGPYLTRDGDAQIGQTVDFNLSGTMDNSYVMVFSLGTFAGYTYPPYGVIEVLPPYVYLSVGTIGAEGSVTYSLNVPNSGGIVGYHFYVQAVEGNDYLYLVSNTVDSEIMP